MANELGNGDRRKETFQLIDAEFQLMEAEDEGRHKFADRIATIFVDCFGVRLHVSDVHPLLAIRLS